MREIPEGGVIPRGYGIVYRHWDRLSTAVAPIPLNFLIKWALGLYWRLQRGGSTPKWNQELLSAYVRGRWDGARAR